VTDPTTDGFADTPGADATPEQDADVRALLAFLRDEPMEMPPEVAARLDAVIAEERRTAALAAGSAPSGLLDPSGPSSSPHATVTVLPTRQERRGPSMRAFTIVGGIAAALLVVVGGVTLVTNLGGGSSSLTTAGSASAASSGDAAKGAAGTTVTASGTAYSVSALPGQATALVLGRLQSGTGLDASAPAVPSPEGTADTAETSGAASQRNAAAFAADKVSACVATLTDSDGSTGVAIDSGTWDGRAALVVVVTDIADPSSLLVFVTTPDCSPSFLRYQRIAKP
jgi:hypothetical protein